MSLILTILPCFVILFFYQRNRVIFKSQCHKLINDAQSVVIGLDGIDAECFKTSGIKTEQEAYALKASIANLFEENDLQLIWRAIKSDIKMVIVDFDARTTHDSTLKSLSKLDQMVDSYDLLNRKLNLERVQSLGNQFTGAGLLFTFAGLSFGIYQGAQSIALTGTSISESIQSLSPLIQAAGVSFLTSLTGLFCSLEFSNFERKLTHTAEMSLNSIFDQLDECVEYVSPSQIQLDIRSYNEKQVALLEEVRVSLVSTSLADIVNQFDETLCDFMSTFLDNIQVYEDRIYEKIQRAEDEHIVLVNSLGGMFTKFNDDFALSFEKQRNLLTKSVEETNTYSNVIVEKYKDISIHLETIRGSFFDASKIDIASMLNLNTVGNDLKNMLKDTNKEIEVSYKKKINDTISDFEDLTQNVTSNIIEKIDEQYSKHSDNLTNVESSLTHLIDVMPGCVNNLVELNSSYHKGLSNLNIATSQTYDVINNIRNVKNDFISVNSATNSTAKFYRESLNDMKVISDNINVLNKTLNKIIDSGDLSSIIGAAKNNVNLMSDNKKSHNNIDNNANVTNSLMKKLFRTK